MYELVADDFDVPVGLERDRFRLRMLTVHDVVKDFDAICERDESVLGCVYVKPSETHDARVQLWVRRSAWDAGLDPLRGDRGRGVDRPRLAKRRWRRPYAESADA